jgi:hypothetical protein
MAAFWLYPLTVWQLTPRILHHLTRTLTKEKPIR